MKLKKCGPRFSESETILTESGKTDSFNRWGLSQHVGILFLFRTRTEYAVPIQGYVKISNNCEPCFCENGDFTRYVQYHVLLLRSAKLQFEIYFGPGNNGIFKIKYKYQIMYNQPPTHFS